MSAARRVRKPAAPARPVIDTAWFAERIAASPHGSARQVAFKMTGARGTPLDPSALTRLLSGQRRMRLEEARQLADLLGCSLTEVLEHAGIESPAGPGALPLVGSVAGDGAVRATWDRPTTQRIAAPPDAPPDAVALACRTSGGELDHLDGATLVCRRPAPPSADAIGRAVVALLADGSAVYGILRRSTQRGRHSVLVGPGLAGARRLDDVDVEAVAPVLWIRLP